MVSDTRLREVVSADFGRAVASRDHSLALTGDFVVMLLESHIVELVAQHLQSQFAVLSLLARDLTLNHDARRLMVKLHLSLDLIDILAASARRAGCLPLQVGRIDLHIHLVSLRQHGHRSRRSMDTSLSLSGRDALNAMHARLIFKDAVCTERVRRDIEDNLLEAANGALGERDHLSVQAAHLAVLDVHAVEVTGEESSLVAASAATNLHSAVLRVVRVRRDKESLKPLLHLRESGLSLLQFGTGKFAQFLVRLIVHDVASVADSVLEPGIFVADSDDALKFGILLVKFHETRCVGDDGRVSDKHTHLLEARVKRLQLRYQFIRQHSL